MKRVIPVTFAILLLEEMINKDFGYVAQPTVHIYRFEMNASYLIVKTFNCSQTGHNCCRLKINILSSQLIPTVRSFNNKP